jgi:hypothetical protein
MPSILETAQSELRKHSLDTFNDRLHGTVTPGCPHCRKSFYTISQLMDHITDDILPGILETAFATATKFVYCDHCKTVVEYEKFFLESEGRTGLEIVCKKCHSPICTFMDSKPADAVESKSQKTPSACPKCGMPLPCGVDGFDAIDVLRCPECDALFERGRFVCHGAKPRHSRTKARRSQPWGPILPISETAPFLRSCARFNLSSQLSSREPTL